MANQYHFITRWRVKGSADEVYDVLSAPLEYPRWWPSVYLMVRELVTANREGLGGRIGISRSRELPTSPPATGRNELGRFWMHRKRRETTLRCA